jgi:Fe-S cluster biogenesis protein NfuA
LINGCVMTACPPEQVERVVERLRPILKRFGGVCLVSDAEWMIHKTAFFGGFCE